MEAQKPECEEVRRDQEDDDDLSYVTGLPVSKYLRLLGVKAWSSKGYFYLQNIAGKKMFKLDECDLGLTQLRFEKSLAAKYQLEAGIASMAGGVEAKAFFMKVKALTVGFTGPWTERVRQAYRVGMASVEDVDAPPHPFAEIAHHDNGKFYYNGERELRVLRSHFSAGEVAEEGIFDTNPNSVSVGTLVEYVSGLVGGRSTEQLVSDFVGGNAESVADVVEGPEVGQLEEEKPIIEDYDVTSHVRRCFGMNHNDKSIDFRSLWWPIEEESFSGAAKGRFYGLFPSERQPVSVFIDTAVKNFKEVGLLKTVDSVLAQKFVAGQLLRMRGNFVYDIAAGTLAKK